MTEPHFVSGSSACDGAVPVVSEEGSASGDLERLTRVTQKHDAGDGLFRSGGPGFEEKEDRRRASAILVAHFAHHFVAAGGGGVRQKTDLLDLNVAALEAFELSGVLKGFRRGLLPCGASCQTHHEAEEERLEEPLRGAHGKERRVGSCGAVLRESR